MIRCVDLRGLAIARHTFIDATRQRGHESQMHSRCSEAAGGRSPATSTSSLPARSREPRNRSAQPTQAAAFVSSARFPFSTRETENMQTLTEKIDLLRTAITELKQVTGSYQGYDRVFCPHILGTKANVWKIFVWQFDGSSSKPHLLPSWRDFPIGELVNVTLRVGDWHRGWTLGRRDQKSIDWIDTVVDPDHAAEVRSISPPRTLAHGPQRRDLRMK